jgi:hypothetical protein
VDGVPDLSHAYPAGIGIWDKVAIDYGYREFDRDGQPFEDRRRSTKSCTTPSRQD